MARRRNIECRWTSPRAGHDAEMYGGQAALHAGRSSSGQARRQRVVQQTRILSFCRPRLTGNVGAAGDAAPGAGTQGRGHRSGGCDAMHDVSSAHGFRTMGVVLRCGTRGV
ncbi:hypothetical protein VFPFJ_01829 [Purpureocillium lilacinum]|uniref:Uncharacterized protein n=1 Tax=Purpureocillium lilacinum TaxID=33203 RepID=A0A179HSY4_PURLI|nr:hypothetical protein VFPFJ_01829 [Purpureocillium lilacinum]OAQ92668.1 hypothetical protein VFPFJ_01829 [Purpureocillium lilacinum]